VICSVISGNHYESKKNFINRKYPFAMFVGTEHKSLIETDVVIDDRSDNLIKFSEGTQKVLYKTKYKQNYDVSGFIHMAGW
jgi:5'(3')-deoxyribonucleotidase